MQALLLTKLNNYKWGFSMLFHDNWQPARNMTRQTALHAVELCSNYPRVNEIDGLPFYILSYVLVICSARTSWLHSSVSALDLTAYYQAIADPTKQTETNIKTILFNYVSKQFYFKYFKKPFTSVRGSDRSLKLDNNNNLWTNNFVHLHPGTLAYYIAILTSNYILAFQQLGFNFNN